MEKILKNEKDIYKFRYKIRDKIEILDYTNKDWIKSSSKNNLIIINKENYRNKYIIQKRLYLSNGDVLILKHDIGIIDFYEIFWLFFEEDHMPCVKELKVIR